jgi:hypothetical protein
MRKRDDNMQVISTSARLISYVESLTNTSTPPPPHNIQTESGYSLAMMYEFIHIIRARRGG